MKSIHKLLQRNITIAYKPCVISPSIKPQQLDFFNIKPNKKISFSRSFNQPINEYFFNDSIKHIEFGFSFNQSLEGVKLPKDIEELTFDMEYNKPLPKLPDTIKEITFYKSQLIYDLQLLPLSLYQKEFNEKIGNSIPPKCKVIMYLRTDQTITFIKE